MFIWRLFKTFLFLILMALLLFWAATYKVKGKPLYQTAQQFLSSEGYKEGIKDLRIFVGGFLKSVGEQIQEDVTEEDKKKLDSMIHEQMKEGDQNGSNQSNKKL
ncbi:MAG: hypothetical protein Q7T03_04190 [Deltaproteobacteria bacterium]|nr:hypothetical protein [Deltaproteobacteria bacterium]